MRLIMTSVLTMLVSLTAMAENQGALLLGFRQNAASTDVDGASIESKIGYNFGGIALIDLTEKLKLRTGFIYAQRDVDAKVGSDTTEYKLTYFDIPVTLYVPVSDMVGVFGGITRGLKSSVSCSNKDGSSCTVDDAKSSIMPFIIGANFKIAPELGFEMYFEKGSEEIVKSVQDFTTVGANVFYTFE